jgi:hypothetical protein
MPSQKLQSLLKSVIGSLENIVSTEVLTYTGELNAIIDTDQTTFDWDKLATLAAKEQGKIELVAATRIEPNFNTINFRCSKEAAPGLMDLHAKTLETTIECRAKFIHSLMQMVPIGE